MNTLSYKIASESLMGTRFRETPDEALVMAAYRDGILVGFIVEEDGDFTVVSESGDEIRALRSTMKDAVKVAESIL